MTSEVQPKPRDRARKAKAKHASHWARTRERGSYTGMRILVWLYRYGGNVLVAPVLYGVVFYFFVTRRATRRYSRLYLQRALGRANIWLVWRHHLAFGRSLMRRVKAWVGPFNPNAVDFPQREALWAMKKRGQGIIFLGTHLGNIDLCRTIVQPGHSYEMNVIVHTRHAEKFNRLLQQLNPENRIHLIQVDQMNPETAMLLRTKLDQGEAVVLLADRVPQGTESRHYKAEFLGSEACFPLGPFWLATLLEVPVYFMTSVETADGGRMLVEPLLAQPEHLPRRERQQRSLELFRAYVAQLEQACGSYPLQWFNFYDFWLDDVRTKPGSKDN